MAMTTFERRAWSWSIALSIGLALGKFGFVLGKLLALGKFGFVLGKLLNLGDGKGGPA
jgi:hypothetical protein